MSISRIYQGRITSAQFLSGNKKPEPVGEPLSASVLENELSSPLYEHHTTFQDAVNYYLAALAALAEALPPHHPMSKLREQIILSWDKFPRPAAGALSMQHSVCKWLGLKHNASFEECVTAIDLVQNAPANTYAHAIDELLVELELSKGDIQKVGRGMCPMFVVKNTGATFPREDTALERRRGELALQTELLDLKTSSAIKSFAKRASCLWTANPNKKPIKNELSHSEKLLKAIEDLEKHFQSPANLKKLTITSSQLNKTLSSHREIISGGKLASEKIHPIPNTNKGGAKKAAVAVFKQFPSTESLAILSSFFNYHADPEKEAKRKQKLHTDFEKAAIDDKRFLIQSKDPIEAARGTRGYVFRAFTALPAWSPESPGKPTWSEFDIAAFKEALKTVNQFKQKTEERALRRTQAEAELDFIISPESKPADWKKIKKEAKITTTGEDEKTPIILGTDPRYTKLKTLLADILDQLEEQSEQEHTRIGPTFSSLRCWRDIRQAWLTSVKKGETTHKDLQKAMATVQKDHQFDFGYAALFDKLTEPEYHELWMPSSEEQEMEIGKRGWAGSVLHAAAHARELAEEVARLKEPIRFTPAEPHHSRRLYMFSDITGADKAKFHEFGAVDVTIAAKQSNNIKKQRLRLQYSAPRLRRDHLDGTPSASRWLQPLMQAFDFQPSEKPSLTKEPALALMPDWISSTQEMRMLLNFPVTLDTTELSEQVLSQIHSSFRWNSFQFNGEKDENLHLYWPGMKNEPSEPRNTPWWKHPDTLKNGISALSVDIGQRRAGDWALLHASSKKTSKSFVELGKTDKHTWHAELKALGSFHLPGEGGKVFIKGEHKPEPYGSRGRHATEKEHKEAQELVKDLIHINHLSDPDLYTGTWCKEKQRSSRTFPEQNDGLIYLLGAALTRYRTWHRWTWMLKEKPEQACKEIAQNRYSDAWKQLAESQKHIPLHQEITQAFNALKAALEKNLVKIAHRVLPLKNSTWKWIHTGTDDHDLPLHQLSPEKIKHKTPPRIRIRGQRGLSFARLEQLDNFRRHLLSMNRLMRHTSGKKAKSGTSAIGESLPDPCEMLTKKLNRMKQERVNQTAHHILAQALGLQLTAPSSDKAERQSRDIHGEYTRIPGRKPVDFIVIEHLDRYTTDKSRAPRENRRLMKWCHRALRNKLVEMCEPFGIPVVETHASYTSKIDARTGIPGFRAIEVSAQDSQQGRWQSLSKKDTPEGLFTKAVFERLKDAPPHARLLLPSDGGTHFIAASKPRQPLPSIRQADQNAAVNIGLRALASPTCFHVHHRIRLTTKQGKYHPRTDNKREALLFNAKSQVSFNNWDTDIKQETTKKPNINLFHDPSGLADWAQASLPDLPDAPPFATQVSVLSAVRKLQWDTIRRLNNRLLEKWELPPIEPDDDIPM